MGYLALASVLMCLLQVPILSEGLDCALSKCRWSPNGHYIACGDVEGKVHVYEAGEVRPLPRDC